MPTKSPEFGSQPQPSPSTSSSDIGAIVGGAVGAVALICLTIFGLALLKNRRQRRNKDNEVQQQNVEGRSVRPLVLLWSVDFGRT